MVICQADFHRTHDRVRIWGDEGQDMCIKLEQVRKLEGVGHLWEAEGFIL